jgi:glycosyltransferase involved in cell wall biosynthesis
MIDVLIVAAVKPEWSSLLAAANGLMKSGARVCVACAFDTAGLPTTGVTEVRTLAMDLRGLRNGRRPRRFTPAWVWVVVRNRVIRVRVRRAPLQVRTWLLAQYDPWLRAQAARADAFVALEQRGVYTVWRLARGNLAAVALLGIGPLKAAVDDLRTVERPTAAGRLPAVAASEIAAAWESALATFGLSQRERILSSAPRVVRALRRLKAGEEAESLARSALAMEPVPETAAWLRLELTATQIGRAVDPDHRLPDTVRDVLAYSDTHLRAGDLKAVVELVIAVAEAVFHRELHAEVDWSPLADDPETFLAPLRASLTFRAVAAPAGALHEEATAASTNVVSAAATAPMAITRSESFARHDPHRLLVISDGNLHFAEGILRDLEAHAHVEIRRLMLRESGTRFGRRDTASMIVDRLGEAVGRDIPSPSEEDAALLGWPDTVLIDWCDNAAVWALLHVPRHVRLVVRLHSIEAFSHQPHMMDWSRVSDLVFVGAHVRDFMLRAVPTMAHAGRVHVLPNEMRLAPFALPKRVGAERTVAMVGWGQKVKDPAWAIEVLARLRATDDRWRLMLIGRDFADSQTTSGARYRERFRERAQRDDVRDGMVFVPYTDDLSEVMRDAGFVMSASLRESFGVGLVECAASAAVPVVRNWPVYAAYGGASAVFPADWVVADVDEAVQRVLEHSDDAVRRRAGETARRHVVQTFDWPVVAPGYREILLGKSSQRLAGTTSWQTSEPGVATGRE